MPRDARGTENWQESANEAAAQKKKKQTSENMANCFFAYSHLLTRIFADSCTRCKSNEIGLQTMSLQTAFRCFFLFISLQIFVFWGKIHCFNVSNMFEKYCCSGALLSCYLSLHDNPNSIAGR